jgi:histone-lysine N-methyltransferase SETMAR
MGKVQKLGVWVPHVLTQHNNNQRVTICASLLTRQRLARQQHEYFLFHIINGDEKWCLYVNFKQRKEWLSPDKHATPRAKPDHLGKTMYIWWDMEGVIHYKLLKRNLTVTSERYCQQLRRLEEAIQKELPGRQHGVILQHDNARPHTANMTKAAIQELDWEILPNSPYSADLAPPDYHLFPSLSNNLRGVSFNNNANLQNWLDEFFTAKRVDFFKRGIENLPERWNAVVNNRGEYIIN